MRACGSCTLCCKVMKVNELDKPVGQWCKHCVTTNGCQIYPDRPQSCRDFQCLWLQGHLPEDWKPNKIKTVLWMEQDEVLMWHEDPNGPETSRHGETAETLQRMVEAGAVVVIVRGQTRRFMGKPGNVIAKMQARGVDPGLVELIVKSLKE